ncbi:MAG TPA: class II glutamine amidotransferase [Myxococcales bacterium]|jgi:glutamine amidotransferase
MCRMLAVRSARPVKIEDMLVHAPYSLGKLSKDHRHGWGLAVYVDGQPKVARGTKAAWQDPVYEEIAATLEGRSLLAHVRKASVGSVQIENCHPFQHGRWLFAHNGTIPDFDTIRPTLEALIAPEYRAIIRGTTDSERCFALFLSRLDQLGGLESPPVNVIASALAIVVDEVRRACPSPDIILNFLATDGDSLVGLHCGNRELCFSASSGEKVVIASQPPDPNQGIWYEIADGEVVGVAPDLTVQRWRLAGPGLAS